MISPKPGQTRFSTVQEVATMLRVSKMTIYRLIEREELAHVRVGRIVRIPTQEVWKYLERQTVQVQAAKDSKDDSVQLRVV